VPNTLSNINPEQTRHIHEVVDLANPPDAIPLSLSSARDNYAQLDLANFSIEAAGLSLDVVDRTATAEIHEVKTRERLTIPLGQSAILGRGLFALPVFEGLYISRRHLILSHHAVEGRPILDILDPGSMNGSHILDDKELANRVAVDPYSGSVVADRAKYEWLFDPNTTPPPRPLAFP
jgi:hypothetical protein